MLCFTGGIKMIKWVVVWKAIAPGSSQMEAKASIFMAESMKQAAEICESRYGKIAGYTLLVITPFS